MRKIFCLLLSIAFVFSLSACGGNESQNVENDVLENSSAQSSNDWNTESEEPSDLNDDDIVDNQSESEELTIDSLVDSYNSATDNQLVYVEDFEVQNKESGHYRTEFRLGAYKEAVGKSYKMDKNTVDIITHSNMFTEQDFRIYASGITLDQCIELIRVFSPLLDSTMPEDTVNETIDYVTEKKEANGYYYGELGLTLFGNDTKGYDLMIKTD